jgi:hypothetical protein
MSLECPTPNSREFNIPLAYFVVFKDTFRKCLGQEKFFFNKEALDKDFILGLISLKC